MNRTERRALAHAARKAERKAGFPTPQTSAAPVNIAPAPMPPVEKPKHEISAAQLAANRANSLKSTGPRPENFHKISQNALKHGLTGRAVVLPSEDADLYESRLRAYQEEFQPVGPEETELLQSIIDVRWRLGRIPGRESAMVEVGREILMKEDPKLAAECDPVTFELHIRRAFEKDFRNLHLHERDLVRRREKEMKEFRALQAERQAKAAAKEEASQTAAKTDPVKPQSAQNGFVFENSQSKDPLGPPASEIPPISPLTIPNCDILTT